MSNLTDKDVLVALKGVKDPDLNKDLVDLGMIKDVVVAAPKVSLTVELTTPACPLKDVIGKDVESAIISKLEGIEKVDITWTSSVRASQPTGNDLLPGVKNVLLIGSGKGGVGKSTLSSNIALALAQSGAKVGLMDADVYGPSIPTAFGLKTRPEATEEQRIIPISKFGLKLMSMGLLLDEGQPVVWRGPMLDGAMRQFLGQVDWGELDYLVLDLPPGTGDVQLSLSRMVPQALSVIVTTPQDIALSDVRRAINMFRQVNVKVIGLIENMSGFVCSHCGHKTDIFLSGGGRKAAEEFSLDLFGEVPLTENVAKHTDSGIPALIESPDDLFSQEVKKVAGKIAQAVAVASMNQGGSVSGGAIGGGLGPAPKAQPEEKPAAGSGFSRL